MICGECGHINTAGANYCSSCGARLDLDRTAAVPAVGTSEAEALEEVFAADLEDVPPGMGVLVVRRGPSAGSRYALDQEVTKAGRHPDSDIFLDDITVSRRHAEVVSDGVEFSVRDVGSLNGTYVNRQRVEEASLSSGDEIQIGRFRLLFLVRPASNG